MLSRHGARGCPLLAPDLPEGVRALTAGVMSAGGFRQVTFIGSPSVPPPAPPLLRSKSGWFSLTLSPAVGRELLAAC